MEVFQNLSLDSDFDNQLTLLHWGAARAPLPVQLSLIGQKEEHWLVSHTVGKDNNTCFYKPPTHGVSGKLGVQL